MLCAVVLLLAGLSGLSGQEEYFAIQGSKAEPCPYLDLCTCEEEFRARCINTSITCLSTLADKLTNDSFVLLTVSGSKIDVVNDDDFPADVYPNLKGLNLIENDIATVESMAFFQLPMLQQINLSSNKIRRLDTNMFSKNKHLFGIILSNNRISKVEFVRSLSSVRYLVLDGNWISVLPNKSFTIFPNSSLYAINLRYNKIRTIEYKAFYGLPHLRFLYLEGNYITAIHPGALGLIPYLTYLYADYNKFVDLTPFSKQSFIRELFLSNNSITTLPNEIMIGPQLSKVEELHLANNSISVVKPRAFQRMKLLWNLDLSGNNISIVHPDTFKSLELLSILNLNRNRISQLQFIQQIPNLEYIYLSRNAITRLPNDTFCSAQVSELFKVDLSHNEMTTVEPKAFNCLGDLEFLDLSWNNLTFLPVQLFTYTPELLELNLSNNRISQVDAFQNMLNLEVIILSHNLITTLPNYTFSNTQESHIKQVYLDNNLIDRVEYLSFDGISELDVLDVSVNRITYIKPNTFPYVHNYFF